MSYIDHEFLLMVIIVWPFFFNNFNFILKLYYKLSLGNIEMNICSILGNLLEYPVHCILVDISCRHFVGIIKETVNIIKDWRLKAFRSLISKHFGPWSSGLDNPTILRLLNPHSPFYERIFIKYQTMKAL